MRGLRTRGLVTLEQATDFAEATYKLTGYRLGRPRREEVGEEPARGETGAQSKQGLASGSESLTSRHHLCSVLYKDKEGVYLLQTSQAASDRITGTNNFRIM